MQIIELWPLTQGEIDGRPDSFVDAMFDLGSLPVLPAGPGRADVLDRVLRGGFPEAVQPGRRIVGRTGTTPT